MVQLLGGRPTYRDETVEPGKVYDYRLADVSYSGEKTYHSVTVLGIEVTPVPEKFSLLPAYPNPFNPTTTLEYHLTHDGKVSLVIYDILGREVTTLVETNKLAGKHMITWNAESISSGVYYCRLIQHNQISTQKLILLK